jgi:hypothetical protein
MVALLSADPDLLTVASKKLSEHYGESDLESEVLPWNITPYYRNEMGEGLLRKFLSFARLVSPQDLPDIKLQTNALESYFARSIPAPDPAAKGYAERRRVNLDPGYLDGNKLVLTSTKGAAHRLYLSQGIYAEVTLLFHHGTFHPFEYTYADYRWPETMTFLLRVRTRYLQQLRGQGRK